MAYMSSGSVKLPVRPDEGNRDLPQIHHVASIWLINRSTRSYVIPSRNQVLEMKGHVWRGRCRATFRSVLVERGQEVGEEKAGAGEVRGGNRSDVRQSVTGYPPVSPAWSTASHRPVCSHIASYITSPEYAYI